jgi:uncharacterized membrane protein
VLLTGALVVTLAWGALAFGAVYPWAYIPLGIACVVIGATGLVAGRSMLRPYVSRGDVRLAPLNRALFFGLALIAIVVALQLVPLPHGTLMRLNPGTDAFLRRYELGYAATMQMTEANRTAEGLVAPVPGKAEALPYREGSHPLSIDPPSTLLGLSLLGVFGVFLLGLTRGLAARDVRRFAPWLVGLGVVLAMVGIIQKATYAGKIYGFWQPYATDAGPFGPFVNRNHFAGWMLMALALGLGYFCALVGRRMRLSTSSGQAANGWRNRVLWFSSAEANRVILVGFGLLVMGLSLVMTLSRSGITCFAIALALSGAAVARRQAKRSRRAVLASYLLFLAVLSVGWAGIDAVAARFAQVEMDLGGRTTAWNDTLHIFRDFPLFGTGIGTFGTAMSVYQTDNPIIRFTESHNDYLQILAEGGLLVTIPALVLLVLFVREVRRRFRQDTGDQMTYWIRVGAVTGLVAIGLQEIVEFSLQVPGNVALFVTLMAIAAGKLPHRHSTARGSRLRAQGLEGLKADEG